MLNIYHSLNQKETDALAEMRAWATSHGSPREQLSGKLEIGQRLIDSGAIGSTDTWKMNAVGVLFGDALVQAIGERLSWVVVEDNLGKAYALYWKPSEALIYPLSAIKERMLLGEAVDLQTLFREYAAVVPVQQT